VLLATVLRQSPSSVLTPDTILVESPGMQHWLNMELARQQGLSMNMDFPLPIRFMWNTARNVLGSDKVPKESPYRREVLLWRIDKLLADDDFSAQADMQLATSYWQVPAAEAEQSLQRLQLAISFADVVEQYLMYRPEWLFAWEEGDELQTKDSNEVWQRCLWRALAKENPYHPARLHKQAVAALNADPAQWKPLLPERVAVFAINTMAPQLVGFLDAIAKIIDVHVFHLNPSVNYWGDHLSKGAQAKQLREQGIEAWMAHQQDNALLANLGKQGRELFNLLTNLEAFEVSAFDMDAVDEADVDKSLLNNVQTDILRASAPQPCTKPLVYDNSITISRSHSTLREVQCLHDFLLGEFAKNANLKPKNVVVMCPAIETYTPFIDAVFQRTGAPTHHGINPPRIPCSIADRAPLDAEPLIAAFVDLLSLPDSRFSVNAIIDYIRLPAMQARFALSPDSLTLLTYWLEQAHVHWGLNSEHKSRVSDGAASDHTFSWEWGLDRLLHGMAAVDSAVIMQDMLTIPDVEGQDSVALGKLIHAIKQLQFYSKDLNQARLPSQWKDTLLALRDGCFSQLPENIDAWENIGRACADLSLLCEQAGYTELLTLRQVREILTKRFSSPDAGNHFMTGQVTFCSMLPMRSIPFSVVAVLGLNDGDFPRQNQPNSIDLMASIAPKPGDRSRRLEDRYLFLEAIISARHSLYLSYQGNSALDNSERQPSLVLQELMEYLNEGYQWQSSQQIRQQALHPFSQGAFQAPEPSFEQGWFRLASAISQKPEQSLTRTYDLPFPAQGIELSCVELARCYADPLAWFANKQLGIYLDVEDLPLTDSEPFTANNLIRYQVIDNLLHEAIEPDKVSIDIKQAVLLNGDLPRTPLAQNLLLQWQVAADILATKVSEYAGQWTELAWHNSVANVKAVAWQNEECLYVYHVSNADSIKRLFEHWLTMLCFNAMGVNKPLHSLAVSWKDGEASVKLTQFTPVAADRADSLLTTYIEQYQNIMKGPSLLHAGLAKACYAKSDKSTDLPWHEQVQLRHVWQAYSDPQNSYVGIGSDVYFQWFFPDSVDVEEVPLGTLEELYLPFFDAKAKPRSGK
jgi:exodeoxyribonuclease V gamma subunit